MFDVQSVFVRLRLSADVRDGIRNHIGSFQWPAPSGVMQIMSRDVPIRMRR